MPPDTRNQNIARTAIVESAPPTESVLVWISGAKDVAPYRLADRIADAGAQAAADDENQHRSH
ncbi:MAG: hypothetical protein M3003_05600 [Candidatus Dormibacteraeota bacterium]|nr:hypothetical protein [Candidatus Dormibacteraeota bacterium]